MKEEVGDVGEIWRLLKSSVECDPGSLSLVGGIEKHRPSITYRSSSERNRNPGLGNKPKLVTKRMERKQLDRIRYGTKTLFIPANRAPWLT